MSRQSPILCAQSPEYDAKSPPSGEQTLYPPLLGGSGTTFVSNRDKLCVRNDNLYVKNQRMVFDTKLVTTATTPYQLTARPDTKVVPVET